MTASSANIDADFKHPLTDEGIDRRFYETCVLSELGWSLRTIIDSGISVIDKQSCRSQTKSRRTSNPRRRTLDGPSNCDYDSSEKPTVRSGCSSNRLSKAFASAMSRSSRATKYTNPSCIDR